MCSRQPIGMFEISLNGEVTCATHEVMGRCVFCGRPYVEPGPAGWRPFGESTLRCPGCLPGAVETQLDARRWLSVIRREMAGIGVDLRTRVRVRLVLPEDLDHGRQPSAGGVLLGVTEHVLYGDGSSEVVEIQIARGQPPLQFGRAVAHEIGHAWLIQHGSRRPDPQIAEGLCELFAHGWLKQQHTELADELRRHLRQNPDPIYGEGFRKVRASVLRNGMSAVLNSLVQSGRLPP